MTNMCPKAVKKATENKSEVEFINDPIQPSLTTEQSAEVFSILQNGFWITIFSKEFFIKKNWEDCKKDFFVSFDQYPHFLGTTPEEIKHVRVMYDTVLWPLLEIYIGIEWLENPAPNTFLGFTTKELDRLKKYNDTQIANGKEPWLSDRLLDFEYWNEINK